VNDRPADVLEVGEEFLLDVEALARTDWRGVSFC